MDVDNTFNSFINTYLPVFYFTFPTKKKINERTENT